MNVPGVPQAGMERSSLGERCALARRLASRRVVARVGCIGISDTRGTRCVINLRQRTHGRRELGLGRRRSPPTDLCSRASC
jgi:hypothetical protein